MSGWIEIAVFSGKAAVIVLSILISVAAVAILIVSASLKAKARPSLEVEDLTEKSKELTKLLQSLVLEKKSLKEIQKADKKAQKAEKKIKESGKDQNHQRPKHVFVLEFDGDIKASRVKQLSDEITAILAIAEGGDEIVLKLESQGGMVHAYGLAAAQLIRLKDHNLHLTVCIDKVAASGGYMMAVTGEKILAAPFAIVGSIGVLAQVPNFHRLLKKHDVDYQEVTAGEYKRTLSLFGEITDKGREKFKEQIEATHQLFKDFVMGQRPQLNMLEVATGEYWYGKQAKELGLIDDLKTSDEYISSLVSSTQVFKIHIHEKQKWSEKLAEAVRMVIGQKVSDSTFERTFF